MVQSEGPLIASLFSCRESLWWDNASMPVGFPGIQKAERQ
jgi:hypothetical protein